MSWKKIHMNTNIKGLNSFLIVYQMLAYNIYTHMYIIQHHLHNQILKISI